METEKRDQVGLAAVEELAEVEGEDARQESEAAPVESPESEAAPVEIPPPVTFNFPTSGIARKVSAIASADPPPPLPLIRSRSTTWLCRRERASSAAGVSSATNLPSLMIIARVQTACTSSKMCVERMMTLSRAMSRMRRRISIFCVGSRPSVGSSRISTAGSCKIACAMPTRRL